MFTSLRSREKLISHRLICMVIRSRSHIASIERVTSLGSVQVRTPRRFAVMFVQLSIVRMSSTVIQQLEQTFRHIFHAMRTAANITTAPWAVIVSKAVAESVQSTRAS